MGEAREWQVVVWLLAYSKGILCAEPGQAVEIARKYQGW